MKTKLFSLLLIPAFLAVGCNSNDVAKKASDQVVTSAEAKKVIEADPDAGHVSLWQRQAGYDSAVFLPADYGKDPTKKYPLILSLHGRNGSVLNDDHTDVGGNKDGFIKEVWNTRLARKFPAIVIAPNWAPEGSSAKGPWVKSLLKQLIAEACEKYNINPEAVIVTGHTQGEIGQAY